MTDAVISYEGNPDALLQFTGKAEPWWTSTYAGVLGAPNDAVTVEYKRARGQLGGVMALSITACEAVGLSETLAIHLLAHAKPKDFDRLLADIMTARMAKWEGKCNE